MYVGTGVYPINCRGSASTNVGILGWNISADAPESDYPVVYPANSAGCFLNCSSSGQQLTFHSIRLMYPDFGFTGYFFTSWFTNNYLTFTRVFFTHNTTDIYHAEAFINIDYGYYTLNNCTFHNIYLNQYSFIRFASSNDYCHLIFNNVTIYSCYHSDGYSIITHTFDVFAFNFTNVLAYDLEAPYTPDGDGSLMHIWASSSCAMTNFTFKNVVGGSPSVRFNDGGYNWVFNAVTFENVTSTRYSAAVYITASSSTYSFVNCTFSSCITQGASGGVIFVHVFACYFFF
jgi:hypothetical protein